VNKTGWYARWPAVLLMVMLLFACAGAAADTDLVLTDDELAFLEEHPTIKLGVDPEFIPYEFFDSDGVYKGISADYLALISEETGLTFEIGQDMTWSEAYESAVERKLDALPCVSKTTQREKYFLFSDPYISFQRVIFVSNNNTDIKSFEDLYGKQVAVQRNSSHHSYLAEYSQITLSLYTNVQEALTAVSNGSEEAFVGNLATSNYLAKSYGITNLKYIPISTEEPQSLYFAVRSDWPELVSILNKALAAIDEESKIAINDKWISVEQSTDYSGLIRLALIVFAVLALIMLVSAYWIIRLRKEIRTRKAIQKDLERAKQEADEANQYKSSFLARMSHEIRTPLNGITGMAYLLKKTELSGMQKLYVERIAQSSGNMLGIINDILDFSKIEVGKVEIESVPFSMDHVIQDVISIVSFKIEEQKIGLKLTKDPMVPNWFLGDAKRLEQILINLMNNAAKFTSEGEVSLDIRLIARENGKCHLTFTVKDTGIGMSDEQIAKLFSPFVQGDVSMNRRFGGTGLGLSIVKNLVDLMDGWIQVFSAPDEGSTFVVHLPLPVDQQRNDAYKKSINADQFKDIRTLVLEKTGANMNLIRGYLESFGMHCELTTSPLSTMSMLQAASGRYAKPFDLLIVDYDTPAEGGFAFVENIFSNERIIKKPRVLMLLPMMREDLFDQLDKYNVDIGIAKPIVSSVLLNGILDIFQMKAIPALQEAGAEGGSEVIFSKPYCILVAEDNKTNQLIAKTLLEQAGCKVWIAENGKVAVELFDQKKAVIDLVLMDLHMPVMNGYEAADAIRKLSANVPIIAMTADVISGVKDRCEQHGIRHCLTKPFEPDYFIRTIQNVVNSSEPKSGILNTDAGLLNMGMQQELYLQILAEYREENLDTAQKLAQAVEHKQYVQAEELVHKIKSSSGSIGAKALYDLILQLQKALKDENTQDIDWMSQKFTGMLETLLDEIDQKLSPSD